MIIPRIVHRSYFSLKRYQLVVFLATLAFAGIFLSYGLFYPGEDALESYMSLDLIQAILGSLDVENPGYLVWVLISTLLLQMYLPIVGILLGGYLLPFMEKDGKEIILTSPLSARRQFLENALMAFGLLWIICLPGYVIAISLAILNDAADGIPNITIGFILAIMLTSVFVYTTAFGAILTFSRKWGYFIGSGTFALTFLLQMFGNETDERIAELSLMYRSQIFKHSLEKTWNIDFIILTLVLSVILILASLFLLQRNDYIEKNLFPTKTSPLEPQEGSTQRLKRVSHTVRTFSHRSLEKIGSRSPAIRDQFHANALIFAAFWLFTVVIVVMVVFQYPGEEELDKMVSGFNSPLLEAFMFGRKMDGSLENYLSYELFAFGWMIYGPFLLLVVNSIVTRDYKDYADITWQLPKSQGEILTSRATAAIIYFVIIFLSNGLTLFIALFLAGYSVSTMNLIQAFFVATWAYSVFVVLFMAISLIPSLKYAQKTLLAAFGISIMILAMAFLLKATWARYLSPFGYFDIVGVLLGEVAFQEALLEGLTCTLIAIGTFVSVIKIRIPSKDLV
ncbi:MAG: hypothetical protein ACFFB3_15165 [Candidatus Hodarchaeota archaeon]